MDSCVQQSSDKAPLEQELYGCFIDIKIDSKDSINKQTDDWKVFLEDILKNNDFKDYVIGPFKIKYIENNKKLRYHINFKKVVDVKNAVKLFKTQKKGFLLGVYENCPHTCSIDIPDDTNKSDPNNSAEYWRGIIKEKLNQNTYLIFIIFVPY